MEDLKQMDALENDLKELIKRHSAVTTKAVSPGDLVRILCAMKAILELIAELKKSPDDKAKAVLDFLKTVLVCLSGK